MSWGGPEFVIAIIAVTMIPWIITTWIKARHGYPLDDGAGGKIERIDHAANARLIEDNRRLSDRLETAEDRLAVLERIVTDSGYRLGHEIERLRDEKGKVE